VLRFRRETNRAGDTTYYTRDGRFRVWQEPYYPRRWFVNESDGKGGWDDAWPADGYETLSEARADLAKNYYGGR
jgi:hypothetical protein